MPYRTRRHRPRYRERGDSKHGVYFSRREALDGRLLATNVESLAPYESYSRQAFSVSNFQRAAPSAPLERQHPCTPEELEEAQRRMFGGEVGDEVSLCEPMIRVVVSLFGDLDYVDP